MSPATERALFFIAGLFPQGPGLLPRWQLVVASFALFNSAQSFLTLALNRKIYSKAVVTPLQARTFGIWTLTSAIVRLYCAYHITNRMIYDLTIWTYVLAGFHFYSEILWYRTAGLGLGSMSPIIVATMSLIWMIRERDHYVKGL